MVFVTLPSRKRPRRLWATPLLAAIALVAFLVQRWGMDEAARAQALAHWGMRACRPDQWQQLLHGWRALTPVTALFLHLNLWHLVGNGLFLLIFGVPAERALGAGRLLTLFLLGGALANATAALLASSPTQVVVGASGGISALIGAYLVLFPRARLGVVVPLGLWLEFVRAPAALLIGLWALLQLIFTLVGPEVGAVAWWAHLAGFLIGAVLALFFLPAVQRRARGR